MLSVAFTLAALAAVSETPATTQHLASPNGHIELVVVTKPQLSYDVLFDGKPLLRGATMSLEVDHVRLGAAPEVKQTARNSVNRTIEPPVRQTAATLTDNFNELRLDCAGGYAIVFRA